jgi:hypothetical protein
MSSLSPTRAEATAHIIDLLRAEEARWAAKVADEVEFPERVLFGQGFACRTGNLALLVRTVAGGQEFVPVPLTANLLGFSRMTRENAERVAEAHPADYRVEHVSHIARNRLAEVRETLAALLALAEDA